MSSQRQDRIAPRSSRLRYDQRKMVFECVFDIESIFADGVDAIDSPLTGFYKRCVAGALSAPTQYQMFTQADKGGERVPSSKFIYQQIPAEQVLHYRINRPNAIWH